MGHQILILIDGIRLNNAIFRLGPNQYLNTIDVNQIERIEVVRGTGSVLYGSDAGGRSFASQLAKVVGADVPDSAKQLILSENLKRLLRPCLQQKGIKV